MSNRKVAEDCNCFLIEFQRKEWYSKMKEKQEAKVNPEFRFPVKSGKSFVSNKFTIKAEEEKMKHHAFTRILSMILAICTVISMSSMALATEVDEPEIPAETIVETQPVETEPAETEPVEAAPVETVPEETVPAETDPIETAPVEADPDETVPAIMDPVETEPEETVPEVTVPEETVPEETVPEETIPEETVPEKTGVELPYGLKGMPEGYVLSDKAMASKAAMNEFGVVKAVNAADEGVDYAAGRIVVGAESEEEAQLIAEAYNGHLKSFGYGIAVIELGGISVAEAVALSADMDIPLPAAYPDEIVRLNPVEDEADMGEKDIAVASLPERQSWETWVLDTMTNPDPFLTNPAGDNSSSAPYQWHHDVVDTYAAWGVTTGESYVTVAVLDTGVRTTHKELTGHVKAYEVPYSYLGTEDDNGHGTHVAGIIAGTMNNGSGGAGIAPGVTIHSYKVLDADGAGYSSDIIRAIKMAADNNAYIINLSLGGYLYNSEYQSAVTYAYKKGTTVIAAMGNDSSNLKCYPAAYSNVIAVGSSNQTNNRSYFSNWGSWQDVSAPGHEIWSAYYDGNGSYVRMNGTSQATPVVAGVAALYMSAKGWVNPDTMEKVLEASCVKGGSNLGKGVVNAANMFTKNKPTVSYSIHDKAGQWLSGTTVPCDGYLCIESSFWADETGVLLYTINGKNPSVKNGEVVNGTQVDESYVYLPVKEYAGKTITVKAMAVNGVGIPGSVKTIKIKVAAGTSISSVTIEGPKNMVAGKSATYTAVVAPAEANQAVTWSIVERSGMKSAKIDAKGKLTTSSKETGYVVIRATSKVNSSKRCDFKVTTEKVSPIASLTLNQKTATLALGKNTSVVLSVTKMTDSAKKAVDPATRQLQWTSSNTKVATVDKNGKVVAVAAGSATITCKVLDGSGKSATCKVTVKKLVEGIAVEGYSTLAPGGSATYKAVCYPEDASSKAVTWSVSGAPAGTKIDSKGKLTLPKSASTGKSFKVVATAKDGSGIMGSTTVTIRAKCTGLSVKYSQQDSRLVKTSGGYLSSAVLYSYEDTYYSGNDTDIQLSVVGKNLTPAVKWTSSNTKVATVDESGYVVAKSAGTAKITAAAQDGSGKKATVTITVRNPVSSMSITTSSLRSFGDDAYLCFGKSATNKVNFADTYGTVSNKAVKWSFEVYGVDEDFNIVKNWTNFVKSKGWVKVDSKGKLTVSSKLQAEWQRYKNDGDISDLVVLVTATSVDNPNVSATQGYFLVKPVSKMFKGYLSGSYIYGDSSTVRIKRNTVYSNGYNANNVVTICCDSYRPVNGVWQFEMTATSSDPNKVGVVKVVPHSRYSNIFYVYLAGGTKTGTATVTVKAGDGSGKSCKFKVNVS